MVLGKVVKPEAKWKKKNGEQRELGETLKPTMWELKDSLTTEKNFTEPNLGPLTQAQ